MRLDYTVNDYIKVCICQDTHIYMSIIDLWYTLDSCVSENLTM